MFNFLCNFYRMFLYYFFLIRKYRDQPLLYFSVLAYNNFIENVITKLANRLKKLFRLKCRSQCKAVWLSKSHGFQISQCTYPTNGTYCAYHRKKKESDYTKYHLLDQFRHNLELLYHFNYSSSTPMPQFLVDFQEELENGFDEPYYAAYEHHYRMRFNFRYQLRSDENHKRWEENLVRIYSHAFIVHFDSVQPIPTRPDSDEEEISHEEEFPDKDPEPTENIGFISEPCITDNLSNNPPEEESWD